MTDDDPINRGTSERVPLSAIVARPEFNARQKYRDIEPLASSIEASGLEQPLVCYWLDASRSPPNSYEVHSEQCPIYLQSGFRRHRALCLIAERRGEPEMLVECKIKNFSSHDEAMFSALAVDTTGDPLRNYDLAVRCDYLQRKYPKRDLPRLVGLPKERVNALLGCLRDLDPKVIGAWEKSPSPEMEIPLTRLARWRKEGPEDQRRLLAAYQNGDEEILSGDGQPARGRRGGRLDGKGDRPTANQLRDELGRVHLRMEDGGGAVETARLEGIAKGLRFAMGELTRVF